MKKNVALPGLTFGLVSATDGSAITSGSPAAYITIDGGSQASATNSPVHEGNGQWSLDLTQAEMNGGVIGVLIALAGAVPVQITMVTETKIVSDLNDIAAGAAMTLADDAITAAKFDESTAFPLKSADTGATAVARTGADSDTLETLSDEIAAVKAETATIVADTNELQSNQGNWLTATGFSTHSAADAATAVWAAGTRTLTSFGTLAADAATAVWAAGTRTLTAISDSSGVTTLLSRILGTLDTGTHKPQSGDAYGVVANVTYGNSAIKTETALIYADTDELQKNQGNWTTATGFATPTNVTDATSPLATSSQAESISQAIDALNDISTSDVQAIIDVIAGATWTDETLEAIKAAVDAIETGGTPLTAEQTAAAVLDAVASEHNTALSIGQKINAAGSAADPLLNDPADYAEGTAGYALASIDDIKTKTDLITTGTEVTLVSPVTDDGNFTIYAGDDYAADESRELSWGPTDIWDALDFSGGTITLIIYRGDTTLEVEGTAGGTTGAKTVTVEMDADDTAAMAGVGAWSYQLHATLDSGSEVTLATGRLTVVDAKQPTAGAE